MTKTEFLLKKLAAAGWVVTNEKDEDGWTKCVAATETTETEGDAE